MVRPALLTVLTLAAAALAACGSSTHKDAAIALRLQQPGSTWQRLKPADQQEALSTCRLSEAVAVARDAGATSAPYYSSRYAAILAIPGEQIHTGLAAWFAGGAHADQTVSQGCTAVVAGLVDLPAMRRTPHADFASPVTLSRDVLHLAVDGDTTELRARISPAGAHLKLASSPGRAPTTATWTVQDRGGIAVVRLRGIPHGTSYLQARVGSWRQSIVVHQAPARRLPAPRTFTPIVLHGQGRVGLPLLYIPQPARLSAQIDRAPLTLSTGKTLLLALGAGAGGEPVPLRPGRYRDVQVRTPGAWSIRIVPDR